MKLLFLDIDGVLNTHEKLPSGYCGIDRKRVAWLNMILWKVPDAKIVISSAWRYLVHRGDMTLKGFEYLLLVHGIVAENRVHGVTEPDPIDGEACHFDSEEWHRRGLAWRAEQIRRYAKAVGCDTYAVVDDLPLDMGPRVFVRVDGLNCHAANKIIMILRGEV